VGMGDSGEPYKDETGFSTSVPSAWHTMGLPRQTLVGWRWGVKEKTLPGRGGLSLWTLSSRTSLPGSKEHPL